MHLMTVVLQLRHTQVLLMAIIAIQLLHSHHILKLRLAHLILTASYLLDQALIMEAQLFELPLALQYMRMLN